MLLTMTRKVNLVWVPGHSGVSGNEKGDELAKMLRTRALSENFEIIDLVSPDWMGS